MELIVVASKYKIGCGCSLVISERKERMFHIYGSGRGVKFVTSTQKFGICYKGKLENDKKNKS